MLLNLEQDNKMHVILQDPYYLVLQRVNSTWMSKMLVNIHTLF